MRAALTPQEVDDALVGAAILGCGGGGELRRGRELMGSALAAGKSPVLVPLHDLAPDGVVVWVYAVGGLTPGKEDAEHRALPRAAEHPTVLAIKALQEHLDRPIVGVVPGEIGGESVAEAFYPAAMLGLPVVDGDSVGRAVPELQHSIAYLRGVPIGAQAVVNEYGETILMTHVSNDRRSEALVRALAVASHNVVWVADHAWTLREAEQGLLEGSVSRARAVGAACREARAAGADTATAVAAQAGGRVAFRGVVKGCMWQERGGFTIGETRLRGRQQDEGSTYRIWFKNENLMAWRDDRLDVTCPDLICMLLPDEGLPLANPHAASGLHVDIIAAPAPAPWHTRAGIAALGPRAFGFDVEAVGFGGTREDGPA